LFGITDSTLRYHLNYLESKNEIRSQLEGRNKCYYPIENLVINKTSDPDSKFQVNRLTKNQERILETIKLNPWITQKNLIIKCGLKGFTVKYNLKKLISYGIVQKKENGRNTCYCHISDASLKKEILKQLIVKLLNHEIDEQTFLKLKHKLE
jgi:predicted transcriptional regulator